MLFPPCLASANQTVLSAQPRTLPLWFIAGSISWLAVVGERIFIRHHLPDLLFGQKTHIALHLGRWNSFRNAPEPVCVRETADDFLSLT